MPVKLIIIVIHFLDWKGLVTWGAFCQAFVVGALMRCRYKAHIGPYVSGIPLFNSIMWKHGAIISGSTALLFFMLNND